MTKLDINDYDALLERAEELLPHDRKAHSRFNLPQLDVIHEGRQTIVRNFQDILSVLRRDETMLVGYLLKELGSAGGVESGRLVIKAKVDTVNIDQRLNAFTDTYVVCSACGSPDTQMTREGRTPMLRCEACGAIRSLKIHKPKKKMEVGEVTVGAEMELTITDQSNKGQGIAAVGQYRVIVSGATKGSNVKVRIRTITGDFAVAELIE